MEDEKYTEPHQQLAWSQEIPNYGDKLLKRLDEFRKTTILYDVRVVANNGDFNAHKVILAACGGIFRSCFIDEERKMISSTITELKLDCSSQGLRPIIRFAYTGALVVTKRNAIATMIAAEVTKMKEVQEICADIAIKEYSWIISVDSDNNTDVKVAIEKVLSLHAPYFTIDKENKTQVEEDIKYELPFLEEVTKSFPDYLATYYQLTKHLNRAVKLLESSESTLDRRNMLSKQPNVENNVHDSSSKTSEELVQETNTEREVSNQTALMLPEGNVKIVGSDDTNLNSTESDTKVTKQPSPPLTKPRKSIRGKKAAPPPPSSPSKPNVQPPPRPQKLPSKVPPPRPKPPSKKSSNGEDSSSKTTKHTEYDDSLNPFA